MPSTPANRTRPQRPTTERVVVGVLAFAAAAIGFAVFATIYTRNLSSDLEAHTQMTLDALHTGTWQGNFLYYLVNAASTGFSESLRLLRGASSVILALAVAAKFLVSWGFTRRELAVDTFASSRWVRIGIPIAVWLLLFSFSIPTATKYLGQLPANVWHNSTTIFLMPFAVWLFIATLGYVRTGERRLLWQVLAAGALNIAIKPSFAMVVLVVFPLACLIRFGFDGRLWRAIYTCAGIAVLLGAQYLYIFQTRTPGEPETGVTIDPFHVWNAYSSDIPLSLLASVAFPVVAVVVYRKRLLEIDYVQYAFGLIAVALLMFVLLTETGPRELDGNFMWQAVATMYVLFLSLTVGVLRIWMSSTGRRDVVSGVIVGAAFLAHTVVGVIYLVSYESSGTFI